MTEHETKYEALAQLLGVECLKALVPATPEQVQAALAAGDEHLNSIPLGRWDGAAGVLGSHVTVACPTCGTKKAFGSPTEWPYPQLQHTAKMEPWRRSPRLSLAERVCVLKHVARYHLLGQVPA